MSRAERYFGEIDNLVAGAVAAINRNAHKSPLETMTPVEQMDKLGEEVAELLAAIHSARRLLHLGVEPDPQSVEREAYDVLVTLIPIHGWARRGFSTRPEGFVSNYHLGEE